MHRYIYNIYAIHTYICAICVCVVFYSNDERRKEEMENNLERDEQDEEQNSLKTGPQMKKLK